VYHVVSRRTSTPHLNPDVTPEALLSTDLSHIIVQDTIVMGMRQRHLPGDATTGIATPKAPAERPSETAVNEESVGAADMVSEHAPVSAIPRRNRRTRRHTHQPPATQAEGDEDMLKERVVPQRITSDTVLLTFKEAMDFLRVSRSTLYRLMWSGQLRGHKVGSTWRFYESDLLAAIANPTIATITTTVTTGADDLLTGKGLE
jgi:excisionase family DNA binding protein